MNSPVVKRSIAIAGHKTSVSLEEAFWTALKDIAAARGVTLSDLVRTLDSKRRQGNLSSAIRLFVLEYFQAQGGNRDTAERGGSDEAHAAMVVGAGATPSITGSE